jgi:hypothetical protein
MEGIVISATCLDGMLIKPTLAVLLPISDFWRPEAKGLLVLLDAIAGRAGGRPL